MVDSDNAVDQTATESAAGPPPAADPWRTDRRGKQYIKAVGRNGIIYRDGEESPEQALQRDGRPRDVKPKRKSKAPPKPPPAAADLSELETILAETFRSPAMACAMLGDEWAANHFTVQGPFLARNLVVAAEKNPWLRKKLENAASGGDMAIMLLTMGGLAAAFVGYAAPPIVWWFNLPVPEKGREMFGIPPRKEHDAGGPPQASPLTAVA